MESWVGRVHWSHCHLPECTAGDINNHFFHWSLRDKIKKKKEKKKGLRGLGAKNQGLVE